jgi:hypothetical protein
MTESCGYYKGKHRRQAMSQRRWYWRWRELLVRVRCQQDYNTVPASRGWLIDAGYCLDNQSEGL